MGINLATQITLLRIILTPVFLIFFIKGEMIWAAVTFVVAALTDGVDGFIARGWHQKTALGSVLDPLADKFLLTTALIGLSIRYNQLIWLIVPIVSRDIILISGTLLIFVSGGKIEIKPNIFGKITTFCQIVMVIFALSLECSNRASLIHSAYFEIWAYLTVIVTLYSGYTYILKGVQWLHEQTTKP